MLEDGVVVKYGLADRAHENEFFRYFARSVKAYFDKKGIPALLMGMPECKVDSRLQIDALLITDKTLTIIDFKDYGGTLMLPDEASFRRGPWETADGIVVKGGSSPNPFYQTGLQRERLVRILETFCRSLSSFNPRFVSTMVCFAKTMNVQGSIPGNVRSYFHIADENTFLEKLFDVVSAGREDAGLLSGKFLNTFDGKVFGSTDYDLEINPALLGVERTQPLQNEPPESSQEAPAQNEKIRSFLEGDSSVLIVTGTVGTNKAQIVPVIREESFRAGFSSARVFALSNRVKRNLGSTIDEVESLYATIFDFSGTHIDDTGMRVVPVAPRVEHDPFSDCDENDTVARRHIYIINESQLVTDSGRTGEMIQFGSGHLLSDLFEYTGIKEEGCEDKIVFVGDKFQLGFGSWSESCLNEAWYGDSFTVETLELPDVQNPTGIQEACLQIANAIRQGRTTNLVLEETDQVRICDSSLERGLLENASMDHLRHKVLAYTNRQACGLNEYIKTRILGNGRLVAPGDIIVFQNQTYAYPSERYQSYGSVSQFDDMEPRRIENGETGKVVAIDTNESNWLVLEEQVSKEEAPIRLTLVNADAHLDSSRISEVYRVPFILEALQSDGPDLNLMQETALKVHLTRLFAEYMKAHPFEGSKHFKEMMESGEYAINAAGQYRDPKDGRYLTIYEKRYRDEIEREMQGSSSEYARWLNAARIKFGWCMTVHKAISSEYDEITFSTKFEGGRRNAGYFRFLYTGISRAKGRVNLVRWEPVSPFEKTEFGVIEQQAGHSAKKPVVLVSTMDSVSADVRNLVETSLTSEMAIADTKSVRYQEIYEIAQGDKSFKAIFDYGNDGKVKLPRYAKGDKELFESFRDSVCGSFVPSSIGAGGQMSWLYDILSRDIVDDCELAIVSSSSYRDVLAIRRHGASVEIRVDYKKDGAISGFKAVTGDIALFSEVVREICEYYAMSNPDMSLWV